MNDQMPAQTSFPSKEPRDRCLSVSVESSFVMVRDNLYCCILVICMKSKNSSKSISATDHGN
jgi:hypothetical protein